MKERVVVFSDAVIAIILTIIVLELPIDSAVNGSIHLSSLFKAVGIYFISFCFVANIWFETAYAFNRIDQVKNKLLVIYMLLLFFLSLVPSATKLLIEDTTEQTILIYGVLTLVVTIVMCRMDVALTKQMIHDKHLQKNRVDELNRQDLLSIIFRILLLVFSIFFVHLSLIIYLILPILAFLQNMVDREEDQFLETLNADEQRNYYQDRKNLWGNSINRYSRLLRDSLQDNNDRYTDRWKQIFSDWIQQLDSQITQQKKQLDKADQNQKKRLEHEIRRLESQKEDLIARKEETVNRLSQKKQRQMKNSKVAQRD